MGTLTQNQRGRFIEEGHLVLDSGLPGAVLDRAVRSLEGRRDFTPMTSRGLEVSWRDPVFLPAKLDRRPWLKRLTRPLRGRPLEGPPVG